MIDILEVSGCELARGVKVNAAESGARFTAL